MKPKVLKSVRVIQDGCDYVELLKDGETYSTHYKYKIMKEPRERKFDDFKKAELNFIKIAMFILSNP